MGRSPARRPHRLFEKITLEGAQAGLSWSTILNKREGYRKAFAGFDPAKVARFTPAKVERLLQDPGIVRNRVKIESDDRQREGGPRGPEGARQPRRLPLVVRRRRRRSQNEHATLGALPARRPTISKAMSKDMKKRGFRFVGPTTMYALMQAMGMVNDHTVDCYRWKQLGGGRKRRR